VRAAVAAPLARLPFVFEPELGLAGLDMLARALEEAAG
jgi:hypothetical protein